MKVVDALTLLKTPQKGRERAEVDRRCTHPHQVRDDAAQFARNDSQHFAALGDVEPHQFLDRQCQTHVVGHRRQVIHSVGQRHDLVVLPIFAELFESRVEITDVRNDPYHHLTVQFHDETQHAVRGRMLRPDVHQHVVAAQLRLILARENPYTSAVGNT